MGVGPNGAVARAEDYANRIIDRLDRLVEDIAEDTTRDELIYRHLDRTTALATERMELTAPVGVIWIVQRIVSFQAANSRLWVYLDDEVPHSRVEFLLANAGGDAKTDVTDNLIYVPAGRKLIFVFHDQSVGGPIGVNIRIRELRTNE